MISSLVIVFREMLEMTLIVGVLLAATRGIPASRRWIGFGVSVGLIGAGLFAIFMEQIESSFDGDGEFLFNAVILILASFLIAWTVFWMSGHARQMTMHMKKIGASVKEGELPFTALAIVSFAAVMREGGEAVFFLFGAAQSVADGGWEMLTGGLLGAAVALSVGVLLYLGLARIPVKNLFSVAGWILMLLAAGMASQATWNLVAIEWLPPLIDPLWNTSALVSQASVAGEFLHVLIGYDEAPSAIQMLVFSLSLAVMVILNYKMQAQHHASGANAS